MPKLNQVLAIEKGVKSRATSVVTKQYHACQKGSALFDGFAKSYQPNDADGEQFPPENKEIQFRADQVVKKVQSSLAELFDVTATKDWANCNAAADITVDGQVVLSQVPVTYLLFLEKQMEHLGTVIDSIPTLSRTFKWNKDENTGVFITQPTSTHKTKKVQKPIVMYPATPEHPAQTEMIVEDVIIGHWNTTHQSGAMTVPEKEALAERVVQLQQAVKQAREEANNSEAQEQHVGAKILGFIFNQ